jgi:acyl-CoA thioesterase-1
VLRVSICWLIALTAAGCHSPSTPSETDVNKVVVLGDSLAVSPSRERGFPRELQERVDDEDLPWVVVNAGVNGDTTAEARRRLEPLLDPDVGVLVVALGANDGLQGVSLSAIENNLSAVITHAQAKGIRVLLCGMETPPFHGFDYSIDFHLIFPRLASRFGIPLVPFLLSGVLFDPDLNGPDFVHPNAEGARHIAATVWPYLEPLLRERRAASDSVIRVDQASARLVAERPKIFASSLHICRTLQCPSVEPPAATTTHTRDI